MANFAYVSGDPDNLTGGAAANMVDIQGPLVDIAEWLNNDLQPRVASAVPTFVTSLPVSAVDGQEIYFQADDTNGIIWHLRYRATSASAYKWEFVGGPPLGAEVVTNESTTSATYASLATAGPSITLPLAGDYIIEQGFLFNNTTGGTTAMMSYDVGAAAALDGDSVKGANAASADIQAHVWRRRRKNGLTAALTLTSKYRVTGGGLSAFYADRWISARPVRVG